jgi:hypothetical protein
MQVSGSSPRSTLTSSSAAPLAAVEDFDQHGYAVPRDTLGGIGKVAMATANSGNEYAQPIVDKPSKHKPKYREKREQIALQQGELNGNYCA